MASSMRDEIDHFAGGCTMLINALDAISTVHPFINAALLAFKGVINLELKRRDNNQKVLALKIQMKSMMSALEPLGSIPDSHVAPDGTILENRFKPLVAQMCKDVLGCGNACDTYTKKRLIAKVLKSYIYEQHLAGFSERFAERRREIMLAISAHTTVVLTEVKHVLSANSELMLQLFRRLDTPRERNIRQSVDERGGPGACMGDDYKLKQLMRMEDGVVVATGDAEGRNDLTGLKRELQESLGESLERNLTQFIGKLRALRDEVIGAIQNVEVSIHREGDRVIADLTKGPHERILDQDIHELWREMHWRYSVKAHHFTFALRDHLIEKYHGMHGKGHVHRPRSDDAATEPTKFDGEVPHANTPTSDTDGDRRARSTENRDADYDAERWAVEAFTMLTVQPITESLDDDGTGFITTQEANEFASSRPEGWSLLKWLIYWGEEWYASLVDYRIKILRIMQRMYDRLQDLHPGNRDTVDRYLYYSAFRRIELLMRGFNVSRPCANQSLRKHYQEYTNQEEVRLRTSLEECDYDLDDTFTLNMVKGPGRIERCIFPLLYLMLRRHLAIIECGKECDLRWWPLYVASYSLGTLIDAVEERAVTLNALMQNSKADGQTGLTSYAFGMFQNMLDASRCAEDTVEDNLLQFFYDGDDEDDADSNDAVCQDLGLEKFDKDDLEERFETHHRNAWCDVCDTMITGDRYACLQCTNRGLRDRIDLCEQCQDQKPSVESLGLTHKASHTLARISFHLHDKDATRVYNDARRALERVKECMAHRAGSAVTASADGASATASIGFPSICGACNAQISRPFWYCSTCCATRTNKRDRDVLSCYDCGRERRHQHDVSHIWILVQDEALLPKLSAVELQLKTLEKRVVDLNSRMANLESKLDDILATQRAA
ncbi:hypothetical protein K525DRAFT_282684 [Schizophyllum commune Loenen D]|nr:hypothetical protein K525DRAFT_282684 [Schizophyllum commune Loenen D]